MKHISEELNEESLKDELIEGLIEQDGYSSEIVVLQGVFRRGSLLHKLWQEIYLKKNPGDY